MARLSLISLDRPGLAPFPLSDRLRSQLVYFQADPDSPGLPRLGEDEYWFDRDDVARWLDDGFVSLVSPLDTDHPAEVELTEDQEELLGWLLANAVRHARVG